MFFAAALAARAPLHAALAPFPFITFFPAIIITALLGGVRPAAGVVAASALFAWYYLLPPINSWALASNGVIGIVFFCFVALVQIGLIEMLHRVIQRMREERARASALIAAREAMFKELQHRVANNMQFVSGLLSMQRRAVDGAAADVLEQAASRLRAMSRIHRRLYDPANADKPFGPLVEELCHELLEATGAKNIVCAVDVPELRLPLDRVLALSMIATEGLTNAVKHAFPDGRPGTIRISLERRNDMHTLVIADDGEGVPENLDVAASPSLGMRIVQALANQLGGDFSYRRVQPGSEFRVTFKPA